MSRFPRSVFLNDRLVPSGQARISVFDRGLLYGDGLFETVRSYRGILACWEEHLTRLRTSAALLGIPIPPRPWETQITALLRHNHLLHTDAGVRVTVTRGPAPLGLLPPPEPQPTVLIIASPVAPELEREQRRGIRAALLPFAKVGWLAEHKLLDYAIAILGRVAALRAGAQEGLYVHDGKVIEGTTSNLFVYHRGRLLTPPVEGLLPGVTRRQVQQLALAEGIAVVEKPVSVRTLKEADEVFVTSSVAEVRPVIRIDGRPVGSGRVGPVTRRIQRSYRQMVDRLVSQRR
jgi:D-amino acid aminotransferase